MPNTAPGGLGIVFRSVEVRRARFRPAGADQGVAERPSGGEADANRPAQGIMTLYRAIHGFPADQRTQRIGRGRAAIKSGLIDTGLPDRCMIVTLADRTTCGCDDPVQADNAVAHPQGIAIHHRKPVSTREDMAFDRRPRRRFRRPDKERCREQQGRRAADRRKGHPQRRQHPPRWKPGGRARPEYPPFVVQRHRDCPNCSGSGMDDPADSPERDG